MVRQEGRIYESCIIPNGDSMEDKEKNYKKLEGVSEEVKKHGADLLYCRKWALRVFQWTQSLLKNTMMKAKTG